MQTRKSNAPQSARTSHSFFHARFASLLLLFALLASHAPVHAAAQTQTQTRERRTATQTARPTPTPAARQTPTPTPSATPTPTPGAQQTPTPTPTPTPASAPPRTVEELRARVREMVARPEFASSNLAIKVA